LTVSAQEAQQIALRIAAPLLGVLVALSILVFAVMRLGVRFVTRSLHKLAEGAVRISQEELDYVLDVPGEDEVGQLGRAFEEMRQRLKARLDELNQLLRVTRGVAESLDFENSVKPILKAAVTTGGCAAYIALVPDILPELEETIEHIYSAGIETDQYKHLCDQILSLSEKQEQLTLTNPARVRELEGKSELPLPEAIFAAALRHESIFYGCLWVAYDQLHQFVDTEENFLATLAGQAASAASNARAYLNAEIGRQRLQAILNSTPDPVLVTDHRDRMFLANPAALDLLGMGPQQVEGTPIHELIANEAIVDLLLDDDPKEQSVEIEMPDGRYFYASTSTVHAEGSRVGRVCILLEITRFKEVDAMKSEFVSSVSHDLRSPLTLMRGYATMLPMVGDLNEQQTGYVNKILGGVESMNRLVTNLLDLGRIEAGIGLKLEMFPVHELVERVTGNYQAQAAHKRIHLDKEIPAHVTPVIEADQALIEQSLQNLIDNAIKYTPTDGKVLVRLIERDDKIVFEVRDTGIGVAPLDIPRLFERFFRGARREARQQKGSGLGLTIVKSIADRHGGQVWVESVLGKGSRFFLEIPIRQPKLGNQAENTAP
jgi:PAS domain S-box-containing protein